MFPRFALTLMVNHDCNLRCSYCFTGSKFRQAMPDEVATRCIERAVAAVGPQGVLELSFFGGEPLLEAHSILRWVDFASQQCERHGAELQVSLTTNGTLQTHAAWEVMLHSLVSLSVSHDGLPSVHNRHRGETSDRVLTTLRQLASAGRECNVVMVVRPDTVQHMCDGFEYLMAEGVRQITPSLDLWAHWTRDDAGQLEEAIIQSADFWSRHWPDLSVSWFDEKAARWASVPLSTTARCQFGYGQIAVSPRGNLYPCERLIGEDNPGHPLRIPGHVFDEGPFGFAEPLPERGCAACSQCDLQLACGTTCRCSNYIRTGNIARPDGLLCWLETLCIRETGRVLSRVPPTAARERPLSAANY